MKLVFKILGIALLSFVVVRSCGSSGQKQNILIGRPAPDFTLWTLSGAEVNMTQLRDGKPALIFFWATWCPHCRGQLQALAQKHHDIEQKGIKIILVDIAEDPREVGAYLKAHKAALDVFLDQDEGVAGQYHIIGVPTFFFVNKEGIIIAVKHELPDNYQEILLRPAA
jgi:peroxiredoxin